MANYRHNLQVLVQFLVPQSDDMSCILANGHALLVVQTLRLHAAHRHRQASLQTVDPSRPPSSFLRAQ